MQSDRSDQSVIGKRLLSREFDLITAEKSISRVEGFPASYFLIGCAINIFDDHQPCVS